MVKKLRVGSFYTLRSISAKLRLIGGNEKARWTAGLFQIEVW
jgi:hypothetical protein